MAGRRLAVVFRALAGTLPDSSSHMRREALAWTHTSRLTSPVASLSNAKFSTSSKKRQEVSSKCEVNGVNIHYDKVGEGSHAVLLLPGALGSSKTDFQPQLKGLNREKYTVICFDPRGYGQSRPPDRDWPLLYLQRDADDAATLMKNLDIPRYSVLGWSDGGITGLILTAANPGVVKKLMIWGANAYVTAMELDLYKDIEDIANWSPRMKQPFIDVYGEEYFQTQWKKWTSAVTEVFKQRDGDFCIGSLPNIKCKTLIVNGLKDPIVAPEHAPFLEKHISNSRMVVWPEGKHNLHLRYHEDFNKLAEEFLDEADD